MPGSTKAADARELVADVQAFAELGEFLDLAGAHLQLGHDRAARLRDRHLVSSPSCC